MVDFTECSALLDELLKVAASRRRMTVPQSRKGRRPMRVDTMLRKEKDGTMYKQAYRAMRDELQKIADDDRVTYSEAEKAYRRLKKLEAEQPTVGELGRGALAGGAVGTVGGLVGKAVSGELGDLVSGFEGIGRGGVKGIPAALGRGFLTAGRKIVAPAATSAVFGAGLPIVRGHLDREAEKEVLEEYLDASKRGRLRGTVKRHLGV